jgi:phage FluMu protein Com
MISIRCKKCNKELSSSGSKPVICGCPNMAMINGDKISAADLSQIVMLNSLKSTQKSGVLTQEDIAWQEERKKRKVRKLDFEVR